MAGNGPFAVHGAGRQFRAEWWNLPERTAVEMVDTHKAPWRQAGGVFSTDVRRGLRDSPNGWARAGG
ncbi:hypothetical protein GCM10023324_29650 [Streptomyces youssoufiensis]